MSTIFVPPCENGRRLIISDIHGCKRSFKALIQKVSLSKEDQLFLLGDYINKGPDSLGVIKLILSLQEKGYQVFPLRGNHEENLLMANQNAHNLYSFLIDQNSTDLLNDEGQLRKKVLRFIRQLPYYYQLEEYILVHAGLNFNIDKPFTDTYSILNIRDFPIDKKKLKGKRIIHGHNPKPLHIIEEAFNKKHTVIPLDNGCVFKGFREHLGNLLCLDLTNWELILQTNIEKLKYS
ncbi:MAG: metallophosphoesterase family protein [Bacteroidota bacterium]